MNLMDPIGKERKLVMIDIQLEDGRWVQAEVCVIDLLPHMVKHGNADTYWVLENLRTGVVVHVLDPERSIVEVIGMKPRGSDK